MTVTKEYLSRYTRKLYKFLDSGHVIKFNKGKLYRGYIDVDINPTYIELDHTDNVISTLIHESLHYFYPEKSENWILSMESKIIHKLSDRQIKNIIKRLAQNI